MTIDERYAEIAALASDGAEDLDWEPTPEDDEDFVLYGLRRGCVGMISGAGAAGKSFLCLELAYGCALGKQLFSFQRPCAKPMKVLFLTCEEDKKDMRRRKYGVRQTFGDFFKMNMPETRALLKQNCKIYPIAGKLIQLPEDFALLRKICTFDGNFSPDLIFLDPLAMLHDCEENDNGQMTKIVQQFTALAQELNAAVVLCHHLTKDAVCSGSMTQTSSRGASGINCAVRWEIAIAKKTTKTQKKSGRVLEVSETELVCRHVKCNGAKVLPDMAFERKDTGAIVDMGVNLNLTGQTLGERLAVGDASLVETLYIQKKNNIIGGC